MEVLDRLLQQPKAYLSAQRQHVDPDSSLKQAKKKKLKMENVLSVYMFNWWINIAFGFTINQSLLEFNDGF